MEVNIPTIIKALNEIDQRYFKSSKLILEITVNDFTFLENNITPNQLNEYLKFTDLLITWYVNSHKELVIHENDNIFDYTIKYESHLHPLIVELIKFFTKAVWPYLSTLSTVSTSKMMNNLIVELGDQARLNLNKRFCFLSGEELPKAVTCEQFDEYKSSISGYGIMNYRAQNFYNVIPGCAHKAFSKTCWSLKSFLRGHFLFFLMFYLYANKKTAADFKNAKKHIMCNVTTVKIGEGIYVFKFNPIKFQIVSIDHSENQWILFKTWILRMIN